MSLAAEPALDWSVESVISTTPAPPEAPSAPLEPPAPPAENCEEVRSEQWDCGEIVGASNAPADGDASVTCTVKPENGAPGHMGSWIAVCDPHQRAAHTKPSVGWTAAVHTL